MAFESLAGNAVRRFSNEDEMDRYYHIAESIMREFQRKYGCTWQCVVGKGYGPNVSADLSFCFDSDGVKVIVFKPARCDYSTIAQTTGQLDSQLVLTYKLNIIYY